MTNKEKIKNFVFRLKIFIWFILTEPLRQLKEIALLFLKIIDGLNKAITWIYLALIFTITSLILGNNYAASLFIIFLMILVILWEWQRGYFMYKYREELKKKIKKQGKKLVEEGKENVR